MSKIRQRILLKLTGKVFTTSDGTTLSTEHIKQVIDQMRKLGDQYQFGLVVGGGNFFRGSEHGNLLRLTPAVGHQIGMLATMMNGLILKDLLEQAAMPTCLLSALACPEIGGAISPQIIETALARGETLIFAGGTGNPFFTTDTNAVLRGLQMKANQVWKATNVEGIFDADPRKNPQAKLIKEISFAQALQQNLNVMDATAFALAAQYQLPIRVFNILQPNALLHAAAENHFGSIVQ